MLTIHYNSYINNSYITIHYNSHINNSYSKNFIETTINIKKNQFVRKKGLDFKKNEILFNEGIVIKSRHIGSIAMTGQTWLSVSRKPIVSILSTGNEIIKVGELSLIHI